jgi:ABC-2 type transport system permease protein
MRSILALIRAGWLEALSYRVQTVFTFVGLLVGIVPLYLVAQALQPVMKTSLTQEGDQYFAFLVTGLVVFAFVRTAVNALPGEVGTSISTGTLEALLGTPTPLPTLLAGLVGYQFVFTMLRNLFVLVIASVLGARMFWDRAPAVAAIMVLLVSAYLAVGIFCAALVVAFRSAGPIGSGVLVASSMLGGVYYPTNVIPPWVQGISALLPMTYGLRALRRTMLEPATVYADVVRDVGVLAVMAAVSLAASVYVFGWALRHARRAGSLSQY